MKNTPPTFNPTAVGEYVHINGRSAMIIEQQLTKGSETYRVRFSDGTFQTGLSKNAFTFPLSNYKHQGCVGNNSTDLCIGDPVYYNDHLATVMGYDENVTNNVKNVKFAIKFLSPDKKGIIDTGFTREMLRIP